MYILQWIISWFHYLRPGVYRNTRKVFSKPWTRPSCRALLAWHHAETTSYMWRHYVTYYNNISRALKLCEFVGNWYILIKEILAASVNNVIFYLLIPNISVPTCDWLLVKIWLLARTPWNITRYNEINKCAQIPSKTNGHLWNIERKNVNQTLTVFDARVVSAFRIWKSSS